MSIELPEGQYVHFARRVRADAGGRTRAMLMRARLLAEYGDVPTLITTYDENPDYPETRAKLRAHGLLSDTAELVNIFEHYRDSDADGRAVLSVKPPAVDGMIATDAPHPDGTIYRTAYARASGASARVEDFRRPDGTVFLRRVNRRSGRARHFLLNTSGEVVGRWAHLGAWVRDWLVEMTAGHHRTFMITDKGYMAQMLRPLPEDRFFLLDVMHSPHMRGDYRWDARLSPANEALLAGLDRLDGLVLLTHRQRDDLAARYGATNNLFVVPNPVILPPEPDPLPTRAAHHFTIIGRLESVKRVGHALRALARLRRHVPEASLDIYGDGSQRSALEEHADRLGLSEAVTFHGFDPAARDSLWTSTAFLMTSRSEGYPLATLEAMSHGCPVVSYDLKYGPRDQITDGTDGFLVAERDITGLADRMLRLTDDPDLRAHMSTAARHTATQHSPDAFAHDWHHVLQAVVDQKPSRVRLDECSAHVTRLDRTGSAAVLEAVLRIGRRTRPRIDLPDPVVSLDAVDEASGEIARLPVTVTPKRNRFALAARFDLCDLFAQRPGDVAVRLRLVSQNAAWQRDIARVPADTGLLRRV